MQLSEVDIIIDYFFSSTPEFLEKLGVDPTRLGVKQNWRRFYQEDYGKPIAQRASFNLVWLSDTTPMGFSTADSIRFGHEAKMHLHVLAAGDRNRGNGTDCVRQSVKHYFEALDLQRLYAEPRAFNIPPNRTLQKAGFKYVKTHKTVPGRINYHQAVTRWIFEREQLDRH